MEGPTPQYGSRYDYLVTCDPRTPVWLDDGDGQYSWGSTDRMIECEEEQAAVIAMSVRFEEARLLTIYEADIGMPVAFRTLTRTGFDDAAIAAVAAQTGAQEVDIELSCYQDYVGYIQVGDRFANCMESYDTVRLTDAPLADALTSLEIGPTFERQLFVYPS